MKFILPNRIYTFYLLIFVLPYKTGLSQHNHSVLSIKDVIEYTLSSNKQIKINYQNVVLAENDSRIAKSDFNAVINLGLLQSRTLVPAALPYRQGWDGYSKADRFDNQLFSYNAGVTKKLYTGTEISSEISVYNNGKDAIFSSIESNTNKGLKSNWGNISFKIKQPLLLGAGTRFNLANVRIAGFQQNAENNNYLHQLSFQVFQSLFYYLEYIYAHRNYSIQHENVENYKILAMKIAKQIELDAIPASDSLIVNAQLSNQISNMIYAKSVLLETKSMLSKYMGLTVQQMDSLNQPPDGFSVEHVEIADRTDYIKKCVIKSLENRRDYLALKDFTSVDDQRVDLYRMKTKHELNLNLQAGYNGLYETNGLDMLYKPYLNNIPGMNYSIGLNLVINPKSEKVKAEYAKALAERTQDNLKKEEFERNLLSDITLNFSQITYLNEIVKQLSHAQKCYKINIEKEYMKLELGTSTLINVIQIYNSFILTENNLNAALRNLNQSVLKFRFGTGTFVTHKGDGSIDIDYTKLFSMPD